MIGTKTMIGTSVVTSKVDKKTHRANGPTSGPVWLVKQAIEALKIPVTRLMSVNAIYRQLCRRASTNSAHRAGERRDALKC